MILLANVKDEKLESMKSGLDKSVDQRRGPAEKQVQNPEQWLTY